MIAASKHVILIVTDAISFNKLCAGQLEYFKSRGVELTLISGGTREEKAILEGRNVGRIVTVPFKRKPSPIFDLYCLLKLMLVLSRLRAVSVVYSTPKAMLLGGIAAFLTGHNRRIAIVRGRAYQNFTGPIRKLYAILDKFVFCLSSNVVIISKSLSEELISEGLLKREKACVLGHGSSNGVNLARFSPSRFDKVELRNKHGWNDGFVFLCLGRICEDKGIRDCVEAFLSLKHDQEFANCILVFAGPSEDENLLKLIKGQSNRGVFYLGPTNKPEELLAVADALLFLSKREGFGNVAIEAAAMEVPVIAYNVVGVRDSVIQGITGELVSPGQVSQVTTAMKKLAEAKVGNTAAFGARARAFVSEHFEQEKVLCRYLGLFTNTDYRG